MNTRSKSKIKSWYPSADMLQLPYVAEKAKEQVREVLAPVLAKMKARNVPIKQGMCWGTSQTAVLLAENPRVKYVEGVWLGGCDNACCNCGGAIRHGWNLVDGYVVDLSEELYVFRGDRQRAPEREPHTIFTGEEVAQHYNDHTAPPTGIISLDKWLLNGGFTTLPAHLKATVGHWEAKELGEVHDLHFNKTTTRLRNRLREKFRGVKSA